MCTTKFAAIIVKPDQAPEIVTINRGLKPLQEVVEGYIECISPFSDEVMLICNEEGKLDGLRLNRAIYNNEGEIIDIIAGTFLVCYAPSESEDFEDMPEELIEKYMELFKYPEIFEVINGNIVSKSKYPNEGGK